MATHSSILAWKIHGQRSLMGSGRGVARSQTPLSANTFSLCNVDKFEKETLRPT